jgi:hypothetical protein
MAIGQTIDHSKPDITVLCDTCKCFLHVSELASHTTYHNALQLYKFKVRTTHHRILCSQTTS